AHLNQKDDKDYFLTRSKQVLQLFNPEWGFFWGKDSLGNWLPDFSETSTRHDHWNDPLFYEGGSRTYSDFVPHAMEELIQLHGGKDAYEKHLDHVFASGFKLGNEPVFLTPYLYNYINKPHKTALRVRNLLDEQFKVGPNGLPGQDDSGAVSAWFVWSSLGLFPVAGQPIYLLGSPVFESASIDLGGGKAFKLKTENYNRDNKYVSGIKLNGQALNRSYITHEEVLAGGELSFIMSPNPDDSWAKESPPSY
ncbi:MAG: glycoside hydrolase domain-containing protein, partial [Bacteroidota bacterium]